MPNSGWRACRSASKAKTVAFALIEPPSDAIDEGSHLCDILPIVGIDREHLNIHQLPFEREFGSSYPLGVFDKGTPDTTAFWITYALGPAAASTKVSEGASERVSQ